MLFRSGHDDNLPISSRQMLGWPKLNSSLANFHYSRPLHLKTKSKIKLIAKHAIVEEKSKGLGLYIKNLKYKAKI